MQLQCMGEEVSGVSSWYLSSCQPTENLVNEEYFLTVTYPSHGLYLEFTLLQLLQSLPGPSFGPLFSSGLLST